MTFKKSIAVNLGIVVSAIVIFAVVLEIGLAVLGSNTKSNIRFIDGKGSTYIPHAYYRHTKEGFSEGYFNAHGFRDFERTYEKPEGTFRIVVFGDSYAEGLQVSLENTFPALLEKKLNESAGLRKFEVLNLGQSGFGTADEYMRFLNFGIQYSPDLVILAFLTGNDFRNNSKVLNHESLAFYFSFDESNNLILDQSLFDEYQKSMTLPKRMFQDLKRNSYLASLLSERIYLLKRQWQKTEIKEHLSGEGEEVREGVVDKFSDLNIYLPELTSLWRESFDITVNLIQKFRDSVSQQGAEFLLVTLSNPEQVNQKAQERIGKDRNLDWDKPDNFLENFAKRNDIMFLKLLPVLRGYSLKTGEDVHGFGSKKGKGHWNEQGHKIAAQSIFEFLLAEQLIPIFNQGSYSAETT